MWNVNPKLMCRQHLLGEHLEMHMFVGTIKKNISMDGYLRNGLVELHNIERRHKELIDEMSRRGFVHMSPLTQPQIRGGSVDAAKNLEELHRRCNKCKRRQNAQILTFETDDRP